MHDADDDPKADQPGSEPVIDRDCRLLLTGLAGLVAAGAAPRALRAEMSKKDPITKETLASAERVADLELTDPERELMRDGVERARDSYRQLRAVELPNSVPPALRFVPNAPARAAADSRPSSFPRPRDVAAPSDLEDVAFWPVSQLAELVRRRRVKSVDLTEMYLARLERYDPKLRCVITLTRERALDQARRADRELAAGRYRGPLHGIPWGVKDLFAVRGYRTTWGAAPFRAQVIDEDATIVRRLDAAGAVLLGKLSVGALAWGDVWFDGTTKNPWNLEQGSSGSSAGSSSATAAGLVGFAIGTETWGSIVSPCTRCGVTGLRPTFGRVSRSGGMALAWTMDKVGPIARSVEDTAMVFDAIHGADGEDPDAVDRPFRYVRSGGELPRLGFVPELFAAAAQGDGPVDAEWRANDEATLAELRALGFDLIPLELPQLPISALSFILSAEAAAAFDELTRSGRDDQLVRQIENAWPNVFRQARMIPAVEYIQANRVRTLVMREMDRVLRGVDAFVAPTFGGAHLLMTNLTGHPAVVLPNGFRKDGTPTSITFTGAMFEEGKLLRVAHAYQAATEFHLRRPALAD